jgi:hypothetical protein
MDEKEKRSPSASPEKQFEIVSRKAAPMPMTQEEVEAMAAGGEEAQAIAERLSIRSTKVAPQPVYEAEMASIQESGDVPKSVRERIERATIEHPTGEKIEKQSPKEVPPKE